MTAIPCKRLLVVAMLHTPAFSKGTLSDFTTARKAATPLWLHDGVSPGGLESHAAAGTELAGASSAGNVNEQRY